MRSQRIEEMEQYILEQKNVTVDQLCSAFQVSKNTVRRDLDELVKRGNVKKIYGGVTIKTGKELPFEVRSEHDLMAKRRIAQKAAEQVLDGDIVFIDSGTTTRHMVEFLKDRKITIFTNSLEIITQAVPFENLEVFAMSGLLNRRTMSFIGSTVVGSMQNYNISKAFMATTGFSVESGVTNAFPMESDIKRATVHRSRHVYLLATAQKADSAALMTYCGLDEIDTLITDAAPPEKIRDFFRERQKEILLVGP